MRLLSALALGGLIAAAAPAARAAAPAFEPTDGFANAVVDFDTVDGRYSVWQVHDIARLDAARLTLQIHRFGDDPRWLPSVMIAVHHGPDFVGLRVARHGADLPVTLTIERWHDGKASDVLPLAATLGLDQKLDVTVSWTPQGAVTIKAGDDAPRTLSLDGAPDSFHLSGSTCEVEFNPLSLGRLR